MARRGFEDNPQLPGSNGWQLRRWIALADAGRLQEEYFQQFIPDQQVERLIKDGTLSRDERVARFHPLALQWPAASGPAHVISHNMMPPDS